MRPKKGAGIYSYYKQICGKTPHQPSPITPQFHIQLPELQQFSKEKRISQFKQAKLSSSRIGKKYRKEEERGPEKGRKPKTEKKKLLPPPPQKKIQNQKPKKPKKKSTKKGKR